MKKLNALDSISRVLLVITTIITVFHISLGDPRFKTLEMICGENAQVIGQDSVPNFVATMGSISEQVQKTGFGTAVTGSGFTISYGLAQCSGDLSLDDCVLCYSEGRTKLPMCYPLVGSRIYLEGCFMRSEDYNFFHEYTGPHDKALCGNETRKSSAFQVSATQAVMEAVKNALSNGGYARADVAVVGTANESAHVVADCLKSVNKSGCKACLKNASQTVFGCFPWSEGWALNTGCFMRYSDTDFLNPVPRKAKSKGSRTVIIISVVYSVGFLVIGGIVGYYKWRRTMITKKRKGSGDAEKLAKDLEDSALNFKYSTLEKATTSFDEANKLGQGGFGTVYKGALPDGREIVVKRLFYNNKAADFYNEVNIVSQLEHKNLVRLLGCSCSGPENLLVYEFLPNLSLDRYIFNAESAKSLNWEKRYAIIIGTAEGLVYLHENTKTRIIHRDIKASNILLDRKMRAKISDFGLARTFQGDKSYISTRIVGTLGYMAPEYLARGQLTEKADVYSFGVLLLEIVTGRRNNIMTENLEYSCSLTTIIWKHFQQGNVKALIDPNLMSHDYYYDKNVKYEALRVVHIGLLCTQEAPLLRPSISKALKMLAKSGELLPPPRNPPFMDEYTMELNDTYESKFRDQSDGYPASVATMSSDSLKPR